MYVRLRSACVSIRLSVWRFACSDCGGGGGGGRGGMGGGGGGCLCSLSA